MARLTDRATLTPTGALAPPWPRHCNHPGRCEEPTAILAMRVRDDHLQERLVHPSEALAPAQGGGYRREGDRYVLRQGYTFVAWEARCTRHYSDATAYRRAHEDLAARYRALDWAPADLARAAAGVPPWAVEAAAHQWREDWAPSADELAGYAQAIAADTPRGRMETLRAAYDAIRRMGKRREDPGGGAGGAIAREAAPDTAADSIEPQAGRQAP